MKLEFNNAKATKRALSQPKEFLERLAEYASKLLSPYSPNYWQNGDRLNDHYSLEEGNNIFMGYSLNEDQTYSLKLWCRSGERNEARTKAVATLLLENTNYFKH